VNRRWFGILPKVGVVSESILNALRMKADIVVREETRMESEGENISFTFNTFNTES
jgi:hypothetical protein